MTKLSITTAWNEAAEILKRDFGALFTVALALVALPNVAMQVLGPGALAPGERPEPGLWLLFFPVVVVLSIAGTLAISSLALGRERVVAAAIAHGFRRLLPMLAVVLLVSCAVILIAALLLLAMGIGPEDLLAPTAGSAGRLLLALLILFLLALFVGVRLMLMTPVAAAEPAGPLDIVGRSWRLTRGHVWKLVGLMLLILLVAAVIAIVVSFVLGIAIVALAGRPEPGNLAGLLMLLVSGLMNAVFTVVFTTLVARIYVQLAGRPMSGS